VTTAATTRRGEAASSIRTSFSRLSIVLRRRCSQLPRSTALSTGRSLSCPLFSLSTLSRPTLWRVDGPNVLTRRSFLVAAAGTAAGLAGCSGSGSGPSAGPTSSSPTTSAAAVELPDCGRGPALWQRAIERGIVYGSSAATWQLKDDEYRRLFEREAAILFTEDDLLWWRLRPTPDSDLDFTFGDRIVGFAERNDILVFGAHLVWDQGFGEGWTDADLRGLDQQRARDLLFGTLERVVGRYRGRVAGWIVANEVLDGSGLRVDVPWYLTIGPSYVAEAFHIAHGEDPDAVLVLNDFGFETDDDFALAADKQAAALQILDELLADDVPVHALGIQAHLNTDTFPEYFDPEGYRRFLADVADRGMKILITEMDVLDDGLPPALGVRDRAVADAMRTYLDVALDEPAVAAVMTFGLSDRYTWLQEDFPRDDGAPRRPLPFDEDLQPKPAYEALRTSLAEAPRRDALWIPPRC
jgi:endo-1,4-beta-xylanase